MKKFFVAILAVLMGIGMAMGQKRTFEVENLTTGVDVYSNDGARAAVLIKAPSSVSLSFSTQLDNVLVARRDVEGSDSTYLLIFETGKIYRERELVIVADNFNNVFLNLGDLQAKELWTYRLWDPNATVGVSCYLGFRNKGEEEFKALNYSGAKNQYVLASQCSDVDSVENARLIALADTCIMLRYRADAAYEVGDLRTASALYYKLLGINSADTYAQSRAAAAAAAFNDDCTTIYSNADYSYNQKDYKTALELYNSIINKKCANSSLAVDKVNEIQRVLNSRKDHTHVITYQYQSNSPIGISTGSYNMNKWGAFFEISFNTKVFDAIRGDLKFKDGENVKDATDAQGKKIRGDYPELNLAFGWTHKIYAPVWIYFGPGVTGKMYYGEYNEKNYPWNKDAHELSSNMSSTDDETKEDAYKHKNFAFAVSPTIGLCVKYSYFAVRIGYQYRFSIQSKLQDFIGRSRLTVGVGVAF